MLTPAISVTSAIEGLGLISNHFLEYLIPLSCMVLIPLFILQAKGTGKIGFAFGPILLIWFLTIGTLGLANIMLNPKILQALSPYYAIHFFYHNGWHGFLLLSGIFLVVTGGEALYADIGHFGKRSIKLSWFFIVFPALFLNYFGQGANLLMHPDDIDNPFYHLAPDNLYIPLIILSTIATVIASQSVISATFCMTKQAVLLGLFPRIHIVQTSADYRGQIYVPQINFLLALGTISLILLFKDSSGLAHAYGIAVNLTMLSVTLMVYFAAQYVWKWSLIKRLILVGLFIIVDLIFLIVNCHKFLTGGWAPILFAIFVTTIMLTWNKGMQYLKQYFYLGQDEIKDMIKEIKNYDLHKVPGIISIFITDTYDKEGGGFLNFLMLSKVLPENILIVNYHVTNIPHVNIQDRIKLEVMHEQIYQLTLNYGFMDVIDLPKAIRFLDSLDQVPFKIPQPHPLYFVEIPHVQASRRKKTMMFHWQEKLFAFLMRNYSVNINIEFFKLPYSHTVALGSYFKI